MTMRREHRGFLMIELVTGLALVAFVVTMMAVALHRQAKVSDRLREAREATMLAERTLTALQTGHSAPASTKGQGVRISHANQEPAGTKWVWVTVDAQVNGRHATLTGLVRGDATIQGETR